MFFQNSDILTKTDMSNMEIAYLHLKQICIHSFNNDPKCFHYILFVVCMYVVIYWLSVVLHYPTFSLLLLLLPWFMNWIIFFVPQRSITNIYTILINNYRHDFWFNVSRAFICLCYPLFLHMVIRMLHFCNYSWFWVLIIFK